MAPDQAKRPDEKAPKLQPRTPALRVKPTFMQERVYRVNDPVLRTLLLTTKIS